MLNAPREVGEQAGADQAGDPVAEPLSDPAANGLMLRSPRRLLAGITTREEFLTRYADQWRVLDPDTFPFVHHIVDEFAVHDDADQLRAGLDLLLAGLRLQAGC